jgi:hypothetical protein
MVSNLSNAKFRIFEPFPAYIDYLKRNNIRFEFKTVDSARCIEFDAHDRLNAKEDFHGICGMCGYVFETRDGKEVIIQSL